MGVLDYLSGLFDCGGEGSGSHAKKRKGQGSGSHPKKRKGEGSGSHPKKRKQPQTVEVKVKLDCEGCERRVRRALEGMKGVEQVYIEPRAHMVTVIGYVDPSKVVSRISQRTGKKAELWPYVPYAADDRPYARGVYDKKAPWGYARHAQDPHMNRLARATSTEVRYTTAFSDENTGACAIM